MQRQVSHSVARGARPRTRGLIVNLNGARPVVRILADDALELARLAPLAELVAHVLEHALARQAGAA